MDYFPVFLKLTDQPCLVIGAGEIAARKIELLSRAGANITVIAREISDTVLSQEASHRLTLLEKSFVPEDLGEFRLVVSATDNAETNQLVAKTATEKNIRLMLSIIPSFAALFSLQLLTGHPLLQQFLQVELLLYWLACSEPK